MGFLLALSLQRHALLLVAATFVLGLIVGRAWTFWSDAARAVKAKLLGAKAERISTVPVPVYSTRGRRGPVDEIPY